MGLERREATELLDGIEWTAEELRENFRDINRVNRHLGGTTLTINGVRLLTRKTLREQPISILDVGTGNADIPVELCRWARRSGRRKLSIVASDVQPAILELADVSTYPEIRLEVHDGQNLPYADNAFDIVINSLFMHHLSPSQCVSQLREMARVARLGIVVNDLVRNPIGYLGALILSSVSTRNRMTRHDGQLSVRRAYTLSELLDLVKKAGLLIEHVQQCALYRVAIVARASP